MKIVLSPYWRASDTFILCIDLFIIIGTLVFCLWSRSEEDIIVIVISGFYIAVSFFLMWTARRLLTSVIVTDEEFASYLLGRKQCTINKTEEIYYVIFKAMENKCTSERYIVISNQMFEYQQAKLLRIFLWDPKPLLGSYDLKRQIVMPYNETTVALLEIDKWIKIA